MDWVRPRCLQEELGLEPGNPAPERLDRPFPLQTPSGGSPALTPYRSMTRHGLRRSAKKGIDFQGPVTEASLAVRTVFETRHFCSRPVARCERFASASGQHLGPARLEGCGDRQ